jgi:hypothetical protein
MGIMAFFSFHLRRIHSLFDKFPQSHGIVTLFVFRTIEQRYGTLGRLAHDRIDRFILVSQLFKVSAFELIPFRPIMCEPFAQCITRCDLFEPVIDPRPFLTEAARPEPVNQYSQAITLGGLVVDPLRRYHIQPLVTPLTDQTIVSGRLLETSPCDHIGTILCNESSAERSQ